MKKIILISIAMLAMSHDALASGKLSLQGNVYQDTGAVRPAAGFSIYQKLMKNIAFNGYLGIGVEDFQDKKDVVWQVAKAEVDFYNGSWTIAPGVALKDTYDFGVEVRSYGYVKLEKTLW
jgi:hypothetical protein